jgi:two-component flavin-dependent monooxygenase
MLIFWNIRKNGECEMLTDWSAQQELISRETLERAARHAPEADRTRDLDPRVLAELKASRANGALVAPEMGGRGVSWAELGRALAALGGACASTAWVFNNFITNQYELARQHWRVAPGLVRDILSRGEGLAGSHAGPPMALREGDSYVLKGMGPFGSGAIYADRLCGSIKVLGPPPEHPEQQVPYHMRYAVYEPGQSGLRVERTWTGGGLRASATDSIHYEGVRVPVALTAYVPERSPQPYLREPPHPMLAESFSITSACLFGSAAVGLATQVLRLAVEQLGGRAVRGGAMAAELPDIQSGLARALQDCVVAASTLQHALGQADERRARGVAPGAAELAHMHLSAVAAMDLALGSVQQSLRLLGGTGMREGPVERMARDVQAMALHLGVQPHAWHGRYGQALCQGGGAVPIV